MANLAKTNLDPAPFRPRARIMRTLGQELISSETVAIIELVKNAYDADAKRVLIRFVPPLKPGSGAVEVIDNGTGMSIDTIRTVWMEPATPSKRKVRKSENLNRRVLGEKGIGRFASARLAGELEVATRRAGAAEEVYALFDWTQFDNDERYLDEILILAEERQPAEICPGGAIEKLWSTDADFWVSKERPTAADLKHGTVLRMTGLKQIWDNSQFEELRRGLARLASPFSDHSDFEIALDLPSDFVGYSKHVEPPPILKYPHYSVKGTVATDGNFDLKIRIYAEGSTKQFHGQLRRAKDGKLFVAGKDGTSEAPKERDGGKASGEKSALPECGPLSIELRVWDRDNLGNIEQKTGSSLLDIRRDLDAVAGINVYRDGFRVLPYGEPKDDWLRLDLRRVQNPTLRLSNNQILGYIAITADDNPKLVDQSNREGLDENQALEDMRQIMHLILARLEQLRYDVRPRKDVTSTGGGESLFAAFDLNPIKERIVKALPDDTATRKMIDAAQAAIGNQLKEIQAVLGRYQRLATLGQLIDVVLHDGRQPIASIMNQAVLGLESIEKAKGLNGSLLPALATRFTTIRKQGDVLATTFRRIEPFGGRRRGRPEQLYIESIISDAFSVFSTELNASHVKVSLPRSQTLVRLDPSEIQEVIVNLLQNSLYWLQQVPESRREIAVEVERPESGELAITFSDSGPGVPAEDKENIFEPYFSTKPNGVGLGLTIAGEIVSDYYNGSLELLNRGPLKGATFRIHLKKRV